MSVSACGVDCGMGVVREHPKARVLAGGFIARRAAGGGRGCLCRAAMSALGIQVGDALFREAVAMVQLESSRRFVAHALYCWRRSVSWRLPISRQVGPHLPCTTTTTPPSPPTSLPPPIPADERGGGYGEAFFRRRELSRLHQTHRGMRHNWHHTGHSRGALSLRSLH